MAAIRDRCAGDPWLLCILLMAAPVAADSGTRQEVLAPTAQQQRSSGAPKKANTAAMLSLIFPGLGHYYLDDHRTAIGLSAFAAAELAALTVTLVDGWPESSDDRVNGIGGRIDDPTFLLANIWIQNTWAWGIFSAWRDARVMGPTGSALVPRESLGDLAVAMVHPDAVLAPEVLLGLAGWVGAAVLLSHWLDDGGLTGGSTTLFESRPVRFMGREHSRGSAVPLGEAYYGALFLPVAIGEESFFRGYLQTNLTERLGPLGGWAIATAVFALAHAPNALLLDDRRERIDYLTQSLPFITLVGGYLGWMYQHNEHSLSQVVAFHFWYDLLLGTVSFLTRPDEQPFSVGIGLPF